MKTYRGSRSYGGQSMEAEVSAMSTPELRGLAREDEVGLWSSTPLEPITGLRVSIFIEKAEVAVAGMDAAELERVLTRGAIALTVSTVLDDVIVPLLAGIGTEWEMGRMRPAQEHLATVVIRRFLEWALGMVGVGAGAPVLVAATPVGERHEVGPLLCAVSGALEGYESIFLGPDLPAEEVVSPALRLDAQVVALSCVDPRTAGSFAAEIRKVRKGLPGEVLLVLGGAVAGSHLRAGGWTGLRYCIASRNSGRASVGSFPRGDRQWPREKGWRGGFGPLFHGQDRV